MYPLTELLRPDFPRAWHEVVALVQHVAAAVGDLATVPAPEDLFLQEDGSLSSGFANEGNELPVTSLAKLLMAGLEGIDAPAQLRSLAVDNAKASPSHPTVAGFTRALSFFERPDRAGVIEAMLTRLSTAKAESSTEQELERLRERIAHAESGDKANTHVEAEPAARKQLPGHFRARQALVAAAIIVVVLGTLGLVGLTRSRSALSAAAHSLASAVRVASADTDAAASPSQAQQSQSAIQKDAPGAHKSAPATRKRDPAPSKTVARQNSTSLPRVNGDSPIQVDIAGPLSQILPLPAFSWTNTHPPEIVWTESHRLGIVPEPRRPLAGHVYSSGEPDVTPARLTRAQLPQEPSPNSETGYFDMVIDEQGDVESVKLLSPTRRYQDRMLVAAAKAWKFTPALMNGTPVKYRLQMPIILHDIPR